MNVVSVIGPDARLVERVTDGLRSTRGTVPRRFVAGAGPGEADGVVAVVAPREVPGTDGTDGSGDRAVIHAVRQAMGVVVVYCAGRAGRGDELLDDPGVILCCWDGRDSAAGPTDAEPLAHLRSVTDGLWVDSDQWSADARRADAERLDRVRIAVRLAADRFASELCGGVTAEGTVQSDEDMRQRDAAFRSRLTVAVLEQGVDMPHLDEAAPVGGDRGSAVVGHGGKDGLVARAVTTVAAVGAGVAAGAALFRFVDSVVLAAVVGVVVAAGAAAVRWWTGRVARREREAAHRTAVLRRHWAATVTDVVARLSVPPVADRIPGGAA